MLRASRSYPLSLCLTAALAFGQKALAFRLALSSLSVGLVRQFAVLMCMIGIAAAASSTPPAIDRGKSFPAFRPEPSGPATVHFTDRGIAHVSGTAVLWSGGAHHVAPTRERSHRSTPDSGQSRVIWKEVYDGIDAVAYWSDSNNLVEYDFVVAPGADPDVISVAFPGARDLRVTPRGDLLIETASGVMRQSRPIAYQMIEGRRTEVEAAFLIRGVETGFRLGPWRHDLPLIVDPIIEFGTYVGGSNYDAALAIVPGPSGDVWIAGVTRSAELPGGARREPSPFLREDLFVMRLNPSEGKVIFSRFLNARGQPRVNVRIPLQVATDAQGNGYIFSGHYALPETPNAAFPAYSFGSLMKIAPSGQVLYSTGLGEFFAEAMAVSPGGSVYMLGSTQSVAIRGTSGAFQQILAGFSDAVIEKFDPDGRLVYRTLLGGSGNELPVALSLDESGNVVVAGHTTSTDFPTTPGAFQTQNAGLYDVFVSRLSEDGARLLSSTYAGSAVDETVVGAVTAQDGSVWLTVSSGPQFPLLSGPLRANDPTVLARVTPDFSRLTSADPSPCRCKLLVAGENLLLASEPVAYAGADRLVSGGAIEPTLGNSAMILLNSEGKQLYRSGTFFSYAGVGPDGLVYLAGASAGDIPVTPNAPYPMPVPPERPDIGAQLDAFVLKVNLSVFRSNNLFISPVPFLDKDWMWQAPLPPPSLTASVTSVAGTLPVEVSTDAPWLEAELSTATTPASLEVRGKADGLGMLGQGRHTAYVTVRTPVIEGSEVRLPVTVSVNAPVVIRCDQCAVDLTTYAGDSQPQDVYFLINSSVTGLPLEIQGTLPGWIRVEVLEPKTPARIRMTIHPPAGPGVYEHVLEVASPFASNSPLRIPVKLTVKALVPLAVSSNTVSFTYRQGQVPPPPVNVRVTTGSVSLPFHVWNMAATLNVTCDSETTPANCLFEPRVGEGLTPDVYTGSVYFEIRYAPANFPGRAAYVDVSLRVIPANVLATLPDVVEFRYRLKAPLPDSQIVPFIGDSSVPFQLTGPPTSWLRWTPSGSTPTSLVFALATIPPVGNYQTTLTMNAPALGSPKPIVVKLTVLPAPRLTATPSSVTVEVTEGDTFILYPAVSIDAGGVYLIAQATASNAPWLSVVESVQVPGGLNLYSPAIPPAGTYRTEITVSSAQAESPVRVPVTLTVKPRVVIPIEITSLVNAASYGAGEIAPGEIVTLFGRGLGPAGLVKAGLDSAGRFPKVLAGTQILFDGIPAPILYTSEHQVAAVVPFALAGRTSTKVSAAFGANRTGETVMAVAPARPGLFTSDSSGSGAGAILNYVAASGGYELNTPATPAERDSIVLLYAAGLGQTMPPLEDGQTDPSPSAQLTVPVEVVIGGRNAELLYRGPAPGSVAGLYQLNVRVPDISPGSAVPVRISAGGVLSQVVTLAIR